MRQDRTAKTKTARPALDPSVTSRLRRVMNRARAYAMIEGVAWVVAFALTAAVVQFLFDYLARGLRWSMRAALLGTIVSGTIWIIWQRVVAPLQLRCHPAQIAKLIERRYPELGSLLVSAVRFSVGDVGPAVTNSPALCASVIARAGRKVASLDFDSVLNPKRALRASLVLVAGLVMSLTAITLSHDIVGLWFRRNILLQNIEWPKRTHLIVDLDGDELIGARGDDLVVEASANGEQPRAVDIIYQSASGKKGRESMVTVGNRASYRYRYTFKNAQEDGEFYLEGGDDQTRTFRLRLLERPRITRTAMRIVPPSYTRLETVTFGDGQRAAQLLPGSTVTIRFETNKPIVEAPLMTGRRRVVEATPIGGTKPSQPSDGSVASDDDSDSGGGADDRRGSWLATFSPDQTHTYHFALKDEVGLENRRPVRFSLRVVQDEPPRARIKLTGVGDMITPEAVLPIGVECADTYGLATVELVCQLTRDDADEVMIPLPSFKSRQLRFTTALAWPVATQSLAPGDSFNLFARATDFNTVTGPGRAESARISLRVVTRDELLAELARREQEYRMDFERLIDSQEQLRSGLLTVMGQSKKEEKAEALAAQLTPLERRQRNIAGSVNVIRQQFEQILSELVVNQLDNRDEKQRLGERIIQPLTQLAKRALPSAADSIRKWSRDGSTSKATLIDRQQVELLSQMRTVLANMVQWEGYQEAVGMLRDIVRLQQELRRETKDALKKQGSDVFDD